jgi:hypothetical protein
MKPILVVIVYLCSSNLSRQHFELQAENLNEVMLIWQEKFKNVDIMHLIVKVERDTEIDVKLLTPHDITEQDRVILKGIQKHLMTITSDQEINNAKTFYNE